MKKVDQPKRLTYRQLSGVKTYNLHVPAKTSAFVVKCSSDPAVQRPGGLATNRHSTPQPPIQIPPVQPRRATEKALGFQNINLWLCNHHNQQSYSNNLFSHSVYKVSIQPRCQYYSLWWSEICRAPRYANAPSYYQNEQSKELLGYQ